MMRRILGRMLFAALMMLPLVGWGTTQGEVLVTVGGQAITDADLQRAVSSSPLADQFPSMDMKDQAALRGQLLKGLITGRLLYLEALERGLDESEAFQQDVAAYRRGELYRAFMDQVRAAIEIPAEKLAGMKEKYKGEPDALAAAKSKFIGDRYKTRKVLELQRLKDQYGFQVHDDRIAAGADPDTVLAEADGFRIRYGDIQKKSDEAFDAGRFETRLYQRAEVLLVAHAAEDAGFDVGARVERYRREALPAFLAQRLEREWIPDEEAERAYFESHPELGRIPERRHVVQIVVEDREKAESLRQRIVDGESMYKLAKEHSVDPYGRDHAGDMGWVKKGLGMPEIEAVLDELPDGEVSAVIETGKGYHLVRIEERKPAFQKTFEAVRDRVRRAMLDERLPAFLKQLHDRYKVEWKMPMDTEEEAQS